MRAIAFLVEHCHGYAQKAFDDDPKLVSHLRSCFRSQNETTRRNALKLIGILVAKATGFAEAMVRAEPALVPCLVSSLSADPGGLDESARPLFKTLVALMARLEDSSRAFAQSGTNLAAFISAVLHSPDPQIRTDAIGLIAIVVERVEGAPKELSQNISNLAHILAEGFLSAEEPQIASWALLAIARVSDVNGNFARDVIAVNPTELASKLTLALQHTVNDLILLVE